MSRNEWIALVVVLAIAGCLRALLLTDGLPDYYDTDEIYTVQAALGIASGNLNTHFYDWPGTLLFNIDAVVYRLAFTFGAPTSQTSLFVMARLVTIAFALGTIALLFCIVRPLGLMPAICATLLVAVSPVHVHESALAMTDVPATFFLLASLFVAVIKCPKAENARCFFWAGIIGGLGCAVKYYVGIVGVGLVVAAFLNPTAGTSEKLKFIGASLVGGLLGFFIGCPWCLFAFGEFQADFAMQLRHQSHGHLGNERTYWSCLLAAVGLPALAAGAYGAVRSFRAGDRNYLPLLATGVGYLLVMSLSQVSFPRYAVPHVPIFGALIAIAAVGLIAHRSLAIVLTILVLIWPTWSTANLCMESLKPDTRVLATTWLEENGYLTKHIIRTGYAPAVPADPILPPFMPFRPTAWEHVRSGKCECVILDSTSTSRFYTAAADKNDADFARPHREFYDWVRANWTLVKKIEADDTNRGPTIDIFIPPAPTDEVLP